MALTTAQLAGLRTAILANPALTAQVAGKEHGQIAAYYNADANPVVQIYKPNLTQAELNTAIVWSEFIALTAGARDAYLAMISAKSIDATNANIRAGFASIFATTVSLTNLTALAQRPATRLEALLTAGGVSSIFGLTITPADIAAALGG